MSNGYQPNNVGNYKGKRQPRLPFNRGAALTPEERRTIHAQTAPVRDVRGGCASMADILARLMAGASRQNWSRRPLR